VLSLSLAITIFSFVGIPPLVGFFAKQMVLSAALDNGYIFISLVAILTSVIGAVYYLNIIKEIFFYSPDYKLNQLDESSYISNNEYNNITNFNSKLLVKNNKITIISSPFSITISVITLVILLFIFMNKE
jgi:NADH-ubiquinone oxidoreductase chain 2